MTTRRQIPVEALTPQAFAPYGWMLAGAGEPPFYSRATLDLWRFPFDGDGPTRLQFMRYRRQPMMFSRLERHVAVTEGRFPVNGARAVLVVGGETAPDAVPEPDDIRAFLIDGSAGVMFRKGVWHGLDCYPVDAPYADFLFLSDEDTELEIEAWIGPESGAYTHVTDYALTHGLEFEVAPVPNTPAIR